VPTSVNNIANSMLLTAVGIPHVCAVLVFFVYELLTCSWHKQHQNRHNFISVLSACSIHWSSVATLHWYLILTSIHEFNMHWKAERDWSSTRYQQHTKYKKTKTNKRQYPLPSKSGLQVQDLCRQSKWNRKDYEGKDLWDRWILIPKRKVEGVIDGESKGGDCDEVICAVWGEPGGQWTEWGWRNEEGSWFHR